MYVGGGATKVREGGGATKVCVCGGGPEQLHSNQKTLPGPNFSQKYPRSQEVSPGNLSLVCISSGQLIQPACRVSLPR